LETADSGQKSARKQKVSHFHGPTRLTAAVFTPVAKALQVKFIVVRSSRWLNYIGEVERGEKTAAADIILKIAAGLKIPTRELLKEV